jgi:hypothetical protein
VSLWDLRASGTNGGCVHRSKPAPVSGWLYGLHCYESTSGGVVASGEGKAGKGGKGNKAGTTGRTTGGGGGKASVGTGKGKGKGNAGNAGNAGNMGGGGAMTVVVGGSDSVVSALDARTWKIRSRWKAPLKYEAVGLTMSTTQADTCYVAGSGNEVCSGSLASTGTQKGSRKRKLQSNNEQGTSDGCVLVMSYT